LLFKLSPQRLCQSVDIQKAISNLNSVRLSAELAAAAGISSLWVRKAKA
jgi:hypothetical protein